MSRFLIVLGIVFIVAGVLYPLVRKLGLGRLPGDIVIARENFRVYIPLGTPDPDRRGAEADLLVDRPLARTLRLRSPGAFA